MAFSVRFRHKLLFKGNPNIHVGDVETLSDSADIKVASELIVDTLRYTVKYADYPSYSTKRVFYLLAPLDKERGGEIGKFYKYLDQNRHKAVLIYFDSKGSNCLMGVPEQDETKLVGGRCFKCYIMEFKQPVLQNMEFTSNSTVGFNQTTENNSTAVRVSEQVLAATHYNDLVREKSSRHMSNIYHMRNLNNFIKTELINMAADMASGKFNKSGVKVIDFGCGMGGDIFKWFKNPQGVL
jgi:hypothetical protein